MNKITGIKHNGQIIKFPLCFPSISTVKTNFSVLDYLKLIKASSLEYFLISAYDIYNQEEPIKEKVLSLLADLKESNVIVLLDSGNYESFWHKDKNWSISLHNEILNLNIAEFCFSYDNQNITNKDIGVLAKIIIDNVISNKAHGKSEIFPIIHSRPEDLENLSKIVIRELNPKFIAIPERLLGDGIINRVKKLQSIRRCLNETGVYTPIHLLGTGSPFSILLFAWAGADTFDGLEWCQTTIDHTTMQTFHFQLRELFDFDNDFDNYSTMTLYQNLIFYKKFNYSLQNAFEKNCFYDLLNQHFSKEFLQKIK